MRSICPATQIIPLLFGLLKIADISMSEQEEVSSNFGSGDNLNGWVVWSFLLKFRISQGRSNSQYESLTQSKTATS